MEGMLAAAHGRNKQARHALRQALDAAMDSPLLRRQILANLATVSLQAGSVEESEAWMEAIAVAGQVGSPADEVLIETVRASIASRRGDLPTLRRAVGSLKEASKQRLAELGTEHPQALAIVANMASAEIMVARAENSVIRMERAVEVLEVAAFRLAAELGSEYSQTKTAMVSLAAVRAGEDLPQDLSALTAAQALPDQVDRNAELRAVGTAPTVLTGHGGRAGEGLPQDLSVLTAAQMFPDLVGRDADLQAVDAALTAAMAGHGGCVVIAGEPGIGKSRLVLETASRAANRGLRVVMGHAVPQAETAAYFPLTEALAELLRNRAVPDDSAMQPWLPALGALLPGITSRAPVSGEIPPAIRGEALIQLLRRLAPHGLVIVLEDLHWADPDTVALMEYLGDHLEGESLLCVLTLRTSQPSAALDMTRRQRGRRGVRHLSLDRLSDADMARMVRACLPDAGPTLLRRVQASAEGVPLLVEDLLASPGLPESFTETIRERLAEFSVSQRSVMEAAAILGRQFDWQLLPAISGQDAALVAETLELAVEQLLVSTDSTAFRFRHTLTRDAVLDTMLPPRQQALAAAALAVLDAAHPRLDGGLRELAVELASRAGDRRRAGTLLGEAGRQALACGTLATAIGTLQRAVDLLEGTPEQDQAELRLVEALALVGRVEEAAAAGGQLITRLGAERADLRTEVHLCLSQAAVAASRWPMARHHIAASRQLAGTRPPAGRARPHGRPRRRSSLRRR